MTSASLPLCKGASGHLAGSSWLANPQVRTPWRPAPLKTHEWESWGARAARSLPECEARGEGGSAARLSVPGPTARMCHPQPSPAARGPRIGAGAQGRTRSLAALDSSAITGDEGKDDLAAREHPRAGGSAARNTVLESEPVRLSPSWASRCGAGARPGRPRGPQRRTSAVCCRPVAGHAAAPGHTAPGVRSAPPCGETQRGTWLCVGPSPPERPLRKEQPRRRGPGPCPGPRLGPPLSVRRPPGPAPQTSRPLPAVCRRPARAAARGARLRVPPPQRAAPATARHGPSATLTRRCCSLPIVFTRIF